MIRAMIQFAKDTVYLVGIDFVNGWGCGHPDHFELPDRGASKVELAVRKIKKWSLSP